jgi:hypothetical protein
LLIVFTAPPKYFGVSPYHVAPVLLSVSTISSRPALFVCRYQITSGSVRTHHQRPILTFRHL